MHTTLTVSGSKGATYTISVNAKTGLAQCTCPAFRFTPGELPCKHILAAAEAHGVRPTRHLSLVS